MWNSVRFNVINYKINIMRKPTRGKEKFSLSHGGMEEPMSRKYLTIQISLPEKMHSRTDNFSCSVAQRIKFGYHYNEYDHFRN